MHRPNLKSLEAPQNLNDAEQEVIAQGDIAIALVNSPAWKMVLDWLEAREDKALGAMRMNKSSDPLLALSLQRVWQERRETLNGIQEHVFSLIEMRRALDNKEE